MKKGWLAFIVTGCLILSLMTPRNAQALSNFKDYNQVGDQYRESMNYLVQSGVLNGYDGKINPKGELTRAEVAKMIAVLVGAVGQKDIVSPTANTKFKDLKNHWASGYVEKLVKYNPTIISGTPEGFFLPDQKVKKDELAKILVTTFSIPLNNSVQVVDAYTSGWGKDYINALASAGVIPTGIFSPKTVPTREYTSLLMHRSKVETARLAVDTNTNPLNDDIAKRLGLEVENSHRYVNNGTFGTQSSISLTNEGLTSKDLEVLSSTLVDFEIEVNNKIVSNTGVFEIYIPLLKKSYILHLQQGEKFQLFNRLALSDQEKKLVTGASLLEESFDIQFYAFTMKHEFVENFRQLDVRAILINGNQTIPVGEKKPMNSYDLTYMKSEFLHHLVTYQYSYSNGTFHFGNPKDNFDKYAQFLENYQPDISRYGKEIYATHTLGAIINLSKGTGSVELQLNYLGKTHKVILKEDPNDYAKYYLTDLLDLTSDFYLLSNLQGDVTFTFVPLQNQKGSAVINLYALDKNKQLVDIPLSEYVAYQ